MRYKFKIVKVKNGYKVKKRFLYFFYCFHKVNGEVWKGKTKADARQVINNLKFKR